MQTGTDSFLIRNATAIAIMVVTLLAVLAAFVFQEQSQSITTAHAWVQHTYDVKSHIQELQTEIRDTAGAVRTYVQTGDEGFLINYHEGLRSASAGQAKSDSLDVHHSINEEIDIVRRQTADNAAQQQSIDEIESTVHDLMGYLASAIEQRKTLGEQIGPELRDPRPVRAYMDHIRGLITLMNVEENHLLALREQADAASIHESSSLIFTSIGIFYALMVLSIWLYQRSRMEAQQSLLRYARELEHNEEELRLQQEELKASNEEIESSNEELEEQNAQIRQQATELGRSKQLIEEKIREIEQASRYKTEFLANMSHELRTPLNSLLILARSFASNDEGNLTDEQIEEATIIHNDGLELLNLINDILDLSKVEAGKLSIVVEDIEIDGIVQRLRQQFAAMAKEKNVAFLSEIAPDLQPMLHTDAHRADQILKNLLSNAFKFTEKGSVTLRVYRPASAEIQRPSLQSDTSVAFSVIDTGIGIDASRFRDIFEAFQQEDGSTERHYGGTGLGLTIARKFAHLLGGELHVRSEKGVGSTFTLILPAYLAAPMQEDDSGAPAALSPVKIIPRMAIDEFVPDDRNVIGENDKILLIVEDDRSFATTLMKIARKRGYKCLVAGTGKTALVMATEEPVTAIILDLKLPDIDGLQVLDQLKLDLRSRHIPVHIISAAAPTDNVVPLRRGAIGFTSKPVAREGIEDAFARIEAMLQSDIKNILVIEDARENQVAIRYLLEKKDIRLAIRETGQDGLQALSENKFDCIVLDLSLPDMTGFEWLERAQNNLNGREMPPVVIYTGKDLTQDEFGILNRYTSSIIIKGGKSPERLLDEVTLFLHSVESSLPKEQREMIRMQHNPDKVLEGRTILLVDDDMRNTFALSKLLKRHGLTVLVADNGLMALEKLRESTAIDMVIMDIMMPVMDGYQAMREIRAMPAFAALPVIALTARAMPEEQDKCIAAGANDYLTKPVDIDRLLTLMRVWLFRQERAV